MKSNERTEYLDDVSTGKEEFRARKPLEVTREDNRRFIRLEISAPMSLQKIKDMAGSFWPEGDWHVINGLILNISGGGVLVELDQAVSESDVVSMHFNLEGVEGIDHVLGVVKRVDAEPDCFIAGIEFMTRDALSDFLTGGEEEMLDSCHSNFDESVRQLLNKYVHRETATERSN